jgi:hypothetical protein
MSTPRLVILVVCFVSLALADDFKTVNGKEYKNVTVSQVEPDGIVLKGKSRISKVYFVELPKDVQERFHYNPVNYEVSLKDIPGVRGGGSERILELVFDRDVPEPQVVDKMLRESLEHAVAAQQKENFTKGLAAYCHSEYPSIWILDKQSGRKLASYGPFRGFEAY